MIVKPMGKKQGDDDTYEILYWSTTAGSLIRWIKKNPKVNNLKRKHDNPLTDDLYVVFEYNGYQFSLETPFADYWIQNISKDCPKKIIDEFIDYLREKKVNKIREWFVSREYKKREKT